MNHNTVKQIQIADFDYPLPDERIARHPLAVRDSCKLLVSLPDGKIEHRHFSDLPGYLPEGSLMVCNDTRVINARMEFRKATGARIEVFLLEPIQPEDYVLMFQSRGKCRWSCLVGNLKRWKEGTISKELKIGARTVTLTAELGKDLPGNAHDVLFRWDDEEVPFASIVDAAGHIPIPPYLKRESEESDADDYQTVYARIKGSVAAPTAGLHFTPAVFDALRKRGVEVMPVTLHVGAGTFQPVKSASIGEHPMHTETFSVTLELVRALISAKESGCKVIAVGTTSVRTLESLPYLGAAIAEGDTELYVDQWSPYEGNVLSDDVPTVETLRSLEKYMTDKGVTSITAATSIMIAPGFTWRITDIMVTNFHQPQSTLLLLVSSFLDRKPTSSPAWRVIYDEALRQDYRFLSYGDACLFFPLDR